MPGRVLCVGSPSQPFDRTYDVQLLYGRILTQIRDDRLELTIGGNLWRDFSGLFDGYGQTVGIHPELSPKAPLNTVVTIIVLIVFVLGVLVMGIWVERGTVFTDFQSQKVCTRCALSGLYLSTRNIKYTVIKGTLPLK